MSPSRWVATVAVSLVLAACAAAPVVAQQPFVGIAAGPERLPTVFGPACPFHGETGSVAGAGADARLGVRLDRVGLEVRAGVRGSLERYCVVGSPDASGAELQDGQPIPVDYVEVLRTFPRRGPGGSGMIEARLRLEFGNAHSHVVTLGSGYFPARRLHYVGGSTGYRWGASHRFGVDAELVAYRVGWETHSWLVGYDATNGWFEVLRERSDPFDQWDLGLALRVVWEFAFSRGGRDR